MIRKIKAITTDRLLLQNLEDCHKQDMVAMLKDPLVKKTYMIPDLESPEQEDLYFQKIKALTLAKNHFVFGIYLNNKLVGFLNDVTSDDKTIEIGYFISPQYWNQGIATEAMSSAIKELFKMGFCRVIAGFFAENAASERVMQKCGMHKINKTDFIEYRGVKHECFYYEVSNPKTFYRKANLNDLDEVMIAVEDSREVLRLQGNGQWQDGYPNRDDFVNDINNGRLFVVFDQNNPDILVGVCALTYFEEDYSHPYEGKWLTDLPYMVMHRVAVKKEYHGKGYGKKLFETFVAQAIEEGYKSVRIDTHEGNMVMRHLIESFGFTYCGKAILKPNKDRYIFEKVL